jgi:TonB family protein
MSTGLEIIPKMRSTLFAMVALWLASSLVFPQPAELSFAEAQQHAVFQPLPQYPALAKQVRISGLVEFKVSINGDGRVASTELISAHPLLLTGTAELIRIWQYRQFKLLDGSPREVTTRIGLQFDASKGSVTLSEPPPLGENLSKGKEAPTSGAAEPYLVTAAVLDEHIRQKKLATWPAAAKAEGITGTVDLTLKINRSGIVTEVTPVSGPPKLIQASMDAVRKWAYRPFLRNGTPVAVTGHTYLTFTLNPDAQMAVFPGDEIDALLDAAMTTVRNLKVEATEKYCLEAMRRAQAAGADHSHTVKNALQILYELYSRAANANEAKREDLYKRWLAATVEYEKPRGQWTARASADLGGYFMSAKRFPEAQQHYQRALEALDQCVDPVGVRICTELQGDVLGYQALTLYAQGKLNDSVPFFENATARPEGAIHPEVKVLSLAVYANVLHQLGRNAEAQSVAKRALEYQIDHPEAARKMGMTH